MVNSVNPYRIEGQKTGAFEIVDQLGCTRLSFYASWERRKHNRILEGYNEYHTAGKINALPKMMGFQAEGAAPIVRGHIVEEPETIATAIRIGNQPAGNLRSCPR